VDHAREPGVGSEQGFERCDIAVHDGVDGGFESRRYRGAVCEQGQVLMERRPVLESITPRDDKLCPGEGCVVEQLAGREFCQPTGRQPIR
jgi:hypothetical protein